jgi:hypothetical protein
MKNDLHWRLYFRGTQEDFDVWIKRWLKEVPPCPKFECTHEAMLCGIEVACPCSIYERMRDIGCSYLCDSVSCSDCAHWITRNLPGPMIAGCEIGVELPFGIRFPGKYDEA